MKTAEERDVMVARVQGVFATYPTFKSWPESRVRDFEVPLELPLTDASYIKALYEICAKGLPVGRTKIGLTGVPVE